MPVPENFRFFDGLFDGFIAARRSCRINNCSFLPQSLVNLFLLKNHYSSGRQVIAVLKDADSVSMLYEDRRRWPAGPAGAEFHYAQDYSPQSAVLLADKLYNGAAVIVIEKNAAFMKIPGRESLKNSEIALSCGLEVDYAGLREKIVRSGYASCDEVGEPGDCCFRGEIIDLWPVSSVNPLRIGLAYDKISGLWSFDPETQKNTALLEKIRILPATGPEEVKISDLLGGNGWGNRDSPPEMGTVPVSPVPVSLVLDFSEDGSADSSFPGAVKMNSISREAFDLACHNLPLSDDNTELLHKLLEGYMLDGFTVTLFTANQEERKHAQGALSGFEYSGQVRYADFYLSRGAVFRKEKAVWLAYDDIFKRETGLARPETRYSKTGKIFSGSFSFGDYVVHSDYGIGIYRGIRKATEQLSTECITVEYAVMEKLHLPLYEISRLHRYHGEFGGHPKLSSLSRNDFLRIKNSARKNAEKIVNDLVKVYAARFRRKGISSTGTEYMEEELAKTWGYELTSDQEKAVREVLSDIEDEKCMDRLVLGDVGYGKTEVAVRAAARTVFSGRQALLLCPTTILSVQHLRVFTGRFAGFPVRIGMLSRFLGNREREKIMEKFSKREIDILIGTHAVLSSKLDLSGTGLVIIDDEQKFGVRQKERLLSRNPVLDVLVMSATPIPRTLSMALSGIKGISVIESAPPGREAVSTSVSPYDGRMMRKAVEFEMARNGQVFFVVPKAGMISVYLDELKSFFPDRKIDYAHGKMDHSRLEKVFLSFCEKKTDILVSTTIVESGLDIGNANTIIIANAVHFGLSQLYQLRGRVGRSLRRGYCYIFYDPQEHLTDKASVRLRAISDFQTLGSGLALAMQDLELRGAGNFLGYSQHGFLNAVGYEMYMELIREEAEKLTGKPAGEAGLPALEISSDASIPSSYISSESLRITFYKKLLSATSEGQVAEIRSEMAQRFGPTPGKTDRLFDYVLLRILCGRAGVSSVRQTGNGFLLSFRKDTVNAEKIRNLVDAEMRKDSPGARYHHSDGFSIEVLSSSVRGLKNILLNI